MSKGIKRIISLALALILAGSCFGAYAARTDAHDPKTCSHTPMIIVPGIMQAQTYLQYADRNSENERENDIMYYNSTIPVVEGSDLNFLFDYFYLRANWPDLILPLLRSLILSERSYFFDAVTAYVDGMMNVHYFDEDGTRVDWVKEDVQQYPYSLEEAKNHPDRSYNYARRYVVDENGYPIPSDRYKTEFDYINAQIDISSYCKADYEGGREYYDHTYYFAYSSFCNQFEVAAQLADYIELVKEQTGHDKVSIVFISLGGVIGNVFLSEYCDPDDPDSCFNDIDRVIFAAAALDGSYLLGDLMGGEIVFDDSVALYNDVLPEMLGMFAEDYAFLGGLANIIIRAVPKSVLTGFVTDLLRQVIDNTLNNILTHCPSMWGLVPSENYPEYSDRFLGDENHAKLKAITDRYYEIQRSLADTIRARENAGMDIFLICGYNLPLIPLVSDYALSSDSIIHVESTSAGAIAAKAGEKLTQEEIATIENYDPKHLSPDGNLYAGTAALPDKTWFVCNQSHLKLPASVDDIIQLCVQITLDKSITSALAGENGGIPQFNAYRDLTEIKMLTDRFQRLIKYGYIAEGQYPEIEKACADSLELRKSNVWDADEALAFEKQLYTMMYDAKLFGEYGVDGEESHIGEADDTAPFVKYELKSALKTAIDNLSDAFTSFYGSRDFYTFARTY